MISPGINRRMLLQGCAVSALSLSSGAAYSAVMVADSDIKALHLLNRIGFGPAPRELSWVKEIGPRDYIDTQLHPEQIAEPPHVSSLLAALTTLKMTPEQLFMEFEPQPPKGGKLDPEVRKAARDRARVIQQEAREARLIRAVMSPRQLEQVMVDFWFNHFNVFAEKGLVRLWIGAYEEQAIRPHALGKFRTLLGATAHHCAMLFYLDNWESVGPNSQAALTENSNGKARGLNENYAREIMELHTLGVNGGYTQADVIALAKILTGWTIHRAGGRQRGGVTEPSISGFIFDDRLHERGDKRLLGVTISGGGQAEGERALDLLAEHPSTAKHVAFKLAQYFVADEPEPGLVDILARRFQDTKGDIREVLRALFNSAQFWAPKSFGAKFKAPYEFVVSALRATGAPVSNWRPLVNAMAQLGQPLYGCLTPDGWKNTKDAWLNPDGMSQRLGFATGLGGGGLRLQAPLAAGAQPPRSTPIDPEQIMATMGDVLSKSSREAIALAEPKLRAAMILGSPEFMQR